MNETITLDEFDTIRWRHCIDLGDGRITKGTKNTFVDLQQWQFPPDLFRGKTVLDVGACDGCFSFYAEKHGATRVLAVDPYRWTYDDRWSGMAGFNYAHRVLGSKVETSTIPLEDISVESVGKWDVVLFLGVFYHLRDPFDITEKLTKVCNETFVLETHIDAQIQPAPVPLVRFYANGEINNDKTTYWGPNTKFLDDFLGRIGFDSHSRTIYGGHRSISYATRRADYRENWGEW